MVDYSKWKNIEISDDEDDQHPNIDTASLNRWRHQARVERMQEAEQEKKELQEQVELHKKKKEEIESKKKQGEDVTKLLEEWQKNDKSIQSRRQELERKEKLTPWNVDTICKEGISKTVVNVKPKLQNDELTEEERANRFKEFTRINKKLMEEFGLLRKFDDSKRFLLENHHLACEDTTNYLTVWCINLAMEDKMSLMEHVSHQCIAMQFMLEFAKQVDRDPRSCISDFYSKIAHTEQTEYQRAFEEELRAFRDRIKKRAEEKIAEALAEAEEEERQERIKASPGGLDPMEVFETLPDELKKCFETQDIPLLQETIQKLSVEDAKYHMKRCVDSGLWVPEAKDKDNNVEGSESDANESKNEDDEAKPKEEKDAPAAES